MKLGGLAMIAVLSEILPFTPLKSNGIVHLAVNVLHNVGIIDDRQASKFEYIPKTTKIIEDTTRHITFIKKKKSGPVEIHIRNSEGVIIHLE
jgi:hypothetical protein